MLVLLICYRPEIQSTAVSGRAFGSEAGIELSGGTVRCGGCTCPASRGGNAAVHPAEGPQMSLPVLPSLRRLWLQRADLLSAVLLHRSCVLRPIVRMAAPVRRECLSKCIAPTLLCLHLVSGLGPAGCRTTE